MEQNLIRSVVPSVVKILKAISKDFLAKGLESNDIIINKESFELIKNTISGVLLTKRVGHPKKGSACSTVISLAGVGFDQKACSCVNLHAQCSKDIKSLNYSESSYSSSF